MQQIIYISKHYCELCKKDIPIQLYGDPTSSFTKKDEPELIEWAQHFHWTDTHRVCAVCGKYVGEDLQVAVNDGSILIHHDYTNEGYKKVTLGDKFGQLLIVHENCVNKQDQNKK